MSSSYQQYIETLALLPHPEGGYYRETYRAPLSLAANALPDAYGSSRNVSTGIYFLLPGTSFSAFHRICSDEMWHFYDGCTLELLTIDSAGTLTTHLLGPNFNNGESFQLLIPAFTWFAAKPIDPKGFSLLGCTVAPGFDFADFELAKREELIADYPQHQDCITAFTRI